MITDPSRLNIVKVTAAATTLAVALVLVVYLLADATGNDLLVAPEFGSKPAKKLELVVALAATVAGGVAGGTLAWLCERLAPKLPVAFVTVCVALLVGYGVLAFARAEENSTAVWLNVMHISAAVPIVGLLARRLHGGPDGLHHRAVATDTTSHDDEFEGIEPR